MWLKVVLLGIYGGGVCDGKRCIFIHAIAVKVFFLFVVFVGMLSALEECIWMALQSAFAFIITSSGACN